MYAQNKQMYTYIDICMLKVFLTPKQHVQHSEYFMCVIR